MRPLRYQIQELYEMTIKDELTWTKHVGEFKVFKTKLYNNSIMVRCHTIGYILSINGKETHVFHNLLAPLCDIITNKLEQQEQQGIQELEDILTEVHQ